MLQNAYDLKLVLEVRRKSILKAWRKTVKKKLEKAIIIIIYIDF